MGVGKAAVAATVISICSGVVLGVFEIQEWHMPTWLAVILIALAGISILWALLMLAHELWIWLSARRRNLGFRWPIYNKSKPYPHQWLLDVAKVHREQPAQFLIVTDVHMHAWDWDEKGPSVAVVVATRNCSLYQMQLGDFQGYGEIDNRPLTSDALPSVTGRNNTAPNSETGLSFRLYFPAQYIARLQEDVLKNQSALKLGRISFEVKPLVEGAVTERRYVPDSVTRVSD